MLASDVTTTTINLYLFNYISFFKEFNYISIGPFKKNYPSIDIKRIYVFQSLRM